MVGISFKIAKSGTRYVPKLSSNVKLQKHDVAADGNGGHAINGITRQAAGVPNPKRPLADGLENSPAKRSRGEVSLRSTIGDFRTRYLDPVGHNVPKDAKASFAINLFPDGFSIDKPTEKGKLAPPASEVSELHLLPYDRNTGDFLRAIDGGWIPSTLLEDIPCQYIDGCVVCELRDYRNTLQAPFGKSLQAMPRIGRDGDSMPTVQRVLLQRNSGSIFKDLKSMDFDGWTYRECLELEARLINTVQPPLCLDPTPEVAKEAYISNYNKSKYNLIYGRYRKTSGSLRERRLHIAAATKALSRADGLANRRRSYLEEGLAGGPAFVNDLVPGGHHSTVLSPGGRLKSQETSKFPQATSGIYIQQQSASQTSLGQQTSMARAGGLAHSMSALSVPSAPVSPSLSLPATPATSAGGYEVTSGLGGASSMLGRRESKESAAAARAEAKHMKTKQAVQLQQRKLQDRQDAKELKEKQRKEKLQQQQQLKIEKQQQLSRSSSHLSLLSQHSDSISMGDGSTTPRSENRSSMVDQRDGSDVVIKMELQEVARPKQEFDSQSFEDVEKGRQELQGADARKQHGQPMQLMGMVQQPPPMNSLLPQTSLPTSGVSFISGIGVQDFRMGPNHNLDPPVGAMAQAQAYALASNLVPAGGPSHMDQMQHSLAQSRQRQNSLPNATTSAMQSPGVTGSFLLPGSGAFPTPGVKVEPATGGQRVTANGVSEDQDQNKEMESMHKLVAAIQRHGLHSRKKPVDNVLLPNKTSSSFHALSVALSETNDEAKEPMGQRSMANSLVGGNINSRKTRSLLFVKTEPKPDQAFQGGMNYPPAFHRSRKRLVLCGRAKDSLVEAIIQVGDDQEEEAVPPHHVLPTMSNVHVADRFAKQYCALLKKENYDLVSDEVQQSAPRNPVVNAASSARALPAGASTLGNPQAGHLATTQRAGMNPQLMQGAIPGNAVSTHNQMQPSSPSQLAANRMPPPSNAPSRQQIMNTHLGQQAVASGAKSTQVDPAQASQLSAQQQQHHQLQQQVQMQRQPQQQQQQQQHQQQQQQQQQHQQQQHQQQQMVTASQLAQLTGQGQNSVSQTNLQQLQYLQQQQQQHQQQQQARQHQHHQLLNQRKLMLPGAMGTTLPGMNNMNGVGMPANAGGQASLANMVNIGGMNNVGMGGMNAMTSMSGISSLGGMSSLGNMGQLGVMNALGQQASLLRPGNMNQAAAMQASKVQHLAAAGRGGRGTGVLPNTAGVVRNQVDALSALGGANQVHGGAGVSVMGQGMNRGNNLSQLQRAQVTGLASPKVPSANQSYYLNSPQLSAQQQQLKSQNAQQLNSQQQQQQLLNSQQHQQQQQQQLLNPQQLNPQQLNTQQLNPQQLNTQKLNSQQLNTQQLNSQQLNTQKLNPQQLNTQQLNPQQLNSQQLNPQQLNTQQLNPQQLNTQQLNPQQLNSQQLNPQQLNTQQLNSQQMNTQQLNPQQLNTQQLNPQLNTQQLNSQQINTQQLNPQQQLSGGGSLNSLVGNPASPQLSSGQTLSAVGNMNVSSSSVELQSASRAAAAAGRAPVIPLRRPTMPQPGQQPQSGQPSQSQ